MNKRNLLPLTYRIRQLIPRSRHKTGAFGGYVLVDDERQQVYPHAGQHQQNGAVLVAIEVIFDSCPELSTAAAAIAIDCGETIFAITRRRYLMPPAGLGSR